MAPISQTSTKYITLTYIITLINDLDPDILPLKYAWLYELKIWI